jgi:hypothetical protein
VGDLAEIQRWFGYRVDDVYGSRLGRLSGFYCDVKSDTPVWMLVRTARATETYHAVPLQGMACGNGRVWIPFAKGHVLASPRVVVSRPVSPAIEARLCRHYDIPLTRGAKMGLAERRTSLYAIGQTGDPGAREAVGATAPRTTPKRSGDEQPKPAWSRSAAGAA